MFSMTVLTPPTKAALLYYEALMLAELVRLLKTALEDVCEAD